MTKINKRITAKCHAHLQTLTKTLAKFQKDLPKTVGVAFTKFYDNETNNKTHGGKSNMSPDPYGGGGGGGIIS